MKSIPTPKTFVVYALFKQEGIRCLLTGNGSEFGLGLFKRQEDAEMARTLAAINDPTPGIFHIFELEIPNPVCKFGYESTSPSNNT